MSDAPGTRTACRSGFVDGFAAPLRGWKYLSQHPGLWRFAIWPVLLNLLITGLVLLSLVAVGIWLVRTVHPWFTEGREGSAWWLMIGLEIIFAGVLLGGCVLIAILVWKIASGILCGVFYGRLAEHIESSEGLPEQTLVSISFREEVVDSALAVGLLVAGSVVLAVLNGLPVLGGLIALVLGTCWTWYILGVDFLGYPLSLRGARRAQQYAFGRRHLGPTLGLGAALFLFQFIPLVGAVVLTCGVVGSVLLHRDLADIESTSPPRVS